MGQAIPHKITRHVHPNAAAKNTKPAAPVPTGIEYLKTVAASHREALAARISYANLPTNPETNGDRDADGRITADSDANSGGDGIDVSAGQITSRGDPVAATQLPGQLDLTDDDQGGQS